MMKLLFVIAGWLCVGLGVLGIILPLLPTTPFLLLALMCFSRGSPRFYAWLYHHPYLGNILREWHEHRRIPRSAIITALILISISIAFSVWLLHR